MSIADQFKMGGVPAEPIFQDIEHRLWLDTAADLEFLRTVYRRFLPTHGIVSLPDVVCALKAEPELRALNGHVKQRDPKLTAKQVLIIHHEGIELTELGRALTERLGVSVDFVCAGETAEEAAYDCIFQLEERSDYDSVEAVNETVLRVKSVLLEEDRMDYEEIVCDLCGHNDLGNYLESPHSEVQSVVCRSCGLAFLSPRLDESGARSAVRSIQSKLSSVLFAQSSKQLLASSSGSKRFHLQSILSQVGSLRWGVLMVTFSTV